MGSGSTSSSLSREEKFERMTGLKPGPFAVGVTTVRIDDPDRVDPGNRDQPRSLQTEIWYPASEKALEMPRTIYSDYLGLSGLARSDQKEEAIRIANGPSAIGGYRDRLTIEELDDPQRTTWLTDAVRDVEMAATVDEKKKWPLVLFSHGSGAYRISYSYWTEFLASHGFVVAACDHPGSARYTIVNGEVVVPGGPRSARSCMEEERPKDVITVLNGMERLSSSDSSGSSIFAGKVDCDNTAVTGMSFGGYTTAAVLEFKDPRIKAAVMKCPSIAQSGTCNLHVERTNRVTPVMMMLAKEDSVLGSRTNEGSRTYVDTHRDGDSYLLEIVRGGHVSFTSCEMYNPDYGNGISANKKCPTVDRDGTYKPLDIVKQHTMINSYGLAFLDTYLRGGDESRSYLKKNHFEGDGELLFRKGGK